MIPACKDDGPISPFFVPFLGQLTSIILESLDQKCTSTKPHTYTIFVKTFLTHTFRNVHANGLSPKSLTFEKLQQQNADALECGLGCVSGFCGFGSEASQNWT